MPVAMLHLQESANSLPTDAQFKHAWQCFAHLQLTQGFAVCQMDKEVHGAHADDSKMQRDVYLDPVFSFNDPDHQELLEAAHNIDLILKKERSEEHLMPEVGRPPACPATFTQAAPHPCCCCRSRPVKFSTCYRCKVFESSAGRLKHNVMSLHTVTVDLCMHFISEAVQKAGQILSSRFRKLGVGSERAVKDGGCLAQLPVEVDEDELHGGQHSRGGGGGNMSFLPCFGKGKNNKESTNKGVQLSSTQASSVT